MVETAAPTDTRTRDADRQVDGATDALRGSARALREAPEAALLFLVVAPIAAAAGGLGGLVRVVGSGVAIYLLGIGVGWIDGPDGDNSLGVRLLVAVASTVVSGIVVLVGLIALVIPGLYAMVRLYLVVPAVVLDDVGPLEALGVSVDRTAGDSLTVAAVMVDLFLVGATVTAVVLALSAGSPGAMVGALERGDIWLPTTAGTLVAGPLNAAAMAVLYRGLDDSSVGSS